MPMQSFSGVIALDSSGALATEVTGKIYAYSDPRVELAAVDETGLQIPLKTNSVGKVPDFRVDTDEPAVWWRSNTLPAILLLSIDSLVGQGREAVERSTEALTVAGIAKEAADTALDTGQSAATLAQAALNAAESAVPSGGALGQVLTIIGDGRRGWSTPTGGGGSGPLDWSQVFNKPTQFPPTGHSHTSGEISDASTVGRAVLVASSQAQARTAIGAGTGNGTSNLTLGTSASTAAPGNHTHSAATVSFAPGGAITATSVQAAIEQAAQQGSSGGGNVTLANLPSTHRFQNSSGVYPPRGTDRADLRITWVGTTPPPIAAEGSSTNFVTSPTAMDCIDAFELRG